MLLCLHGEGIARGDHGVLGLGVLGLAPHVREDLVQHVGTTGWRRAWTVWQWVVAARSHNLPLGCWHQSQLQGSLQQAASTSLSKTSSVGTISLTAESSPTSC